jgi:adenylate kinase family enzyme
VRIAILGTSGSGKTTLSRTLGARLGLPVIELDAINWRAGWRDLYTDDPDEFRRLVDEATSGPAWVCDGNYAKVRTRVLERATDVVWLDYSRAVVMRRVIGRSFARAISGKELWPGTGNTETFARWLSREHPIRWAWDTYEVRRVRYADMFADAQLAGKRLTRIRRPSEAQELVEALARNYGDSALIAKLRRLG